MNFSSCRCGGIRMRPPNTGPDAHPICRICDRTAPSGRWHPSDVNPVWHTSTNKRDFT